MKPSFALNFSHDGLVLLHREGSDWRAVGEISLADPDLTEVATRLRRSALALEPRGILSKLIIPASQILYTEVRAPGPDAASRRAQIAEALEGRTPYDVSDLVFDWFGRGEVVQVAVVARETLAEAEAFADLYGFCPVSFVASPEPGRFAAEPFFGLTLAAAQHLPEGARLDRDQDPVRVLAASAAVATEPDAAAADLISEPETAALTSADAPAEWSEDAKAEGLPEPVAAEADDLPPFAEPEAEPVLTQAEATWEADLEDAAAATAELADEVATESSEGAPSADLADMGLPWESDFEGAEARNLAEPPDTRSDAAFAGAPADLDPVAPLQDATGFDLEAPDPAHPADETDFAREAMADLEPEPDHPEVTTEPDLPPELDPSRPFQTDDLPPPAFLAPEEPPEAPFADLTQEDDPEAAVGLPLLIDPAAEETRPTFASIRTAAGRAPKLGAATTEPAAPRKLGGAGLPRVLDPGIDLPGPDVAAVARSLAGAKDRARGPAPPAGRKPLTAGGRKPAIDLKAKPAAPQEPAAATDRTVFGARRLEPLPSRPRHLWLVLTLALVLFMLVVAIWSSFLDDPPEVAAPETAPAAEVVEAAPPPAAPQPEAASQPADPAPQQTAPAQAAATPAAPSAVWGERAAPDAGLSLAALSTSDPLADQDRTARPSPTAPKADPQPAPLPLPAPFAQLARLGPGGEITPTVAGVAMPGGFTLFAGRPPVVSKPRPEGLVVEAPAPDAAAAPEAGPAPYADPALSGFKPRSRPADLAPVEEDGAALAPLPTPDDPTLANRKPRGRPDSIAKAAADAAASLMAQEQAAAAAAQAASASASAQAVAESRRPTTRPQDLAPSPVASAAVEAAVAAAVSAQEPPARVAAAAPAPEPERAAADPEEVEQDEPETTSAMPKLPTSASVAKQATQTNALNLGKINLIGLYGAANNRRALVRMPNGKFVKVGVGDRLDGGRVTAIGSGKLTYQKSGRSVTLELLKGG